MIDIYFLWYKHDSKVGSHRFRWIFSMGDQETLLGNR